MQTKKKASAPSFHTSGTRYVAASKEAATIIPFEGKRPTAQEQLEIFGLGMAGEQDVAEAKKWIEANPEAWQFMLSNARRLKEKGYVSINYLVNMVRNELHVGCKNGIAPALVRIMEARYPELRGAFNKHRSQSDGFSE